MFSLSFIGLWHIAAYAGLLGHLVLFLTAPPRDYGFGWSGGEAIRLYGLFAATVHVGPLIGGWIADAFTGKRRAALLDLTCATLGIFLFSGVSSTPALVGSVYDAPVREVLLDADVSIGRIGLDAEESERLERALEAAKADETLRATMRRAYGLTNPSRST